MKSQQNRIELVTRPGGVHLVLGEQPLANLLVGVGGSVAGPTKSPLSRKVSNLGQWLEKLLANTYRWVFFTKIVITTFVRSKPSNLGQVSEIDGLQVGYWWGSDTLGRVLGLLGWGPEPGMLKFPNRSRSRKPPDGVAWTHGYKVMLNAQILLIHQDRQGGSPGLTLVAKWFSIVTLIIFPPPKKNDTFCCLSYQLFILFNLFNFSVSLWFPELNSLVCNESLALSLLFLVGGSLNQVEVGELVLVATVSVSVPSVKFTPFRHCHLTQTRIKGNSHFWKKAREFSIWLSITKPWVFLFGCKVEQDFWPKSSSPQTSL